MRLLAAVAALTALLGTSCGAGDEGSASGGATEGAALYANNCAVCHGPEGEGTSQGPPLVHIIYEPSHHPDESFHRAVRDGVVPHHWDFGPMPPLPAVPPEDVDAIIAHVRELQRAAGIQ